MRSVTVSLVLVALLLSAQAIDVSNFAREHQRFPGPMSQSRLEFMRRHMMKRGRLESKEDIYSFIKGFAYGFDLVMGDPAACVHDVEGLLYDFETGAKLIGQGIRSLSVKDVADGLLDFADGVEKLVAALRDCGIQKTAEDIARIVSEIRSGEIKTFIENEVVHILGHGRELIQLFKALVSNFQSRNYYGFGEAVGEILAILIDQDGNNVEVTPKDVYDLVRGVAEGLGGQMGDPSVCTKDIDTIISDFNAAWDDLIRGIKKVSVSTISRAIAEFADGIEKIADSMNACGLEKLEEEIRDVVAQIRSGKALQIVAREAVHIFCHGSELINDFKSVAAYWKGGQYEECGKKVGAIIAFIVVIPPAAN